MRRIRSSSASIATRSRARCRRSCSSSFSARSSSAALKQQDLFAPRRVADYLFEKDRLFAGLTLDAAEMGLYEQVASRLDVDPPKPDLVVYLQAPVETLLARIARRGIAYENSIDAAYLTRLNDAYARFFHEYDARAAADRQRRQHRSGAEPGGLRRAGGRDPAHAQGPHVLQPVAPRYYLSAVYTHLEQRDSTRPPVSLGTLAKMKRDGEKIACITCYDASFAVLCDNADVDLVLVGDSLGMVLQGHDTTVPVTMDDIVYHSQGGGARTAPALPGGRPAVRELPDPGSRAREFGAPHAGGRRRNGEAGERHRPARDRRVPRAARHRGVRAPGTEAAVGAQDRRLSRAGPRRRRRAAHARECARAGIRRRRHRAARVHSVRARQAHHRSRSKCR